VKVSWETLRAAGLHRCHVLIVSVTHLKKYAAFQDVEMLSFDLRTATLCYSPVSNSFSFRRPQGRHVDRC
jgi:hypothetical protein